MTEPTDLQHMDGPDLEALQQSLTRDRLVLLERQREVAAELDRRVRVVAGAVVLGKVASAAEVL